MLKLVYIRSIEKVKAEDLTSLEIISESSCRLAHDVTFEKINIHGLVGVNVEDTYDNNQRMFTTTATFLTYDKEPIAERQLAYRVTSIEGQCYLIGTNARPFPVIKEKNPFPEKPGDSILKTVTITWKSLLPMLRIIK